MSESIKNGKWLYFINTQNHLALASIRRLTQIMNLLYIDPPDLSKNIPISFIYYETSLTWGPKFFDVHDVKLKMAVVNTIYCFPSSRIIFDEYNIG